MAARPRDEGAKSGQGWDDGASVNQQFNLRNQQGLGRHPQHQFQRPPVIPRRDQDDTLRSDQQARKFQPQVKLTAMQGQQLEKPLADGGQPQTTAIIKAKKPRPPLSPVQNEWTHSTVTIDMVFGKLGYPITFTLEEEGFQPAQILEVDFMDHDGDA
ncbi:hypothetical protein OsI_19313 [Oryza sativa Indica Group]|uniref:Uncharacterized protein n=2 Tax=Oryza sativa TaxID=4530 RepID=B9FNP4_ORYSJ|nr:hypothetical protein OsI_19313 [Oryza sativa Indica Group]EEE63114.1 hypothetical protein OsJ_17922 [Oryza sativa Japonica Group]